MGIIVQFDDVKNLFSNVVGNYLIDNFEYEDIDFNDEQMVSNLIENYIVTKFDQLDENEKEWLKKSLSYFITHEPSYLNKLNNDGLLPLELPLNPKTFFIKIWNRLYNNEDYQFIGKPDKILY